MRPAPSVWFPAIRTNSGTDVFTERLVARLQEQGVQAAIAWLPLRAEYAPWSVAVPDPPSWATICHVNTWLHPRFIPSRLPVIATLHHSVHDPALRPYKGWPRAAYHRLWIAPMERRVLRRADRVVAVSGFVADMARSRLCDAPMQVIHNGIDTDLFRPPADGGGAHVPFRLLYVGSWIARKGVDLLAPIMRALGDGFELHYTGGAAAQQDKASMPSNMHDIGRLSTTQVVQAMQEADAFLFPSRSEGLPLVVVEAMASGLPVISMIGSAVEEVVEDGGTGLLCGREDVDGMAEAVRRFASSHERAAMRARARQAAVTRFSERAMVDAYHALYAETAEQWK